MQLEGLGSAASLTRILDHFGAPETAFGGIRFRVFAVRKI